MTTKTLAITTDRCVIRRLFVLRILSECIKDGMRGLARHSTRDEIPLAVCAVQRTADTTADPHCH